MCALEELSDEREVGGYHLRFRPGSPGRSEYPYAATIGRTANEKYFSLGKADQHYYYASRLPGEPAEGVDDIHFHLTES